MSATELYHFAAYRFIHSRVKMLGTPYRQARFQFFGRFLKGRVEPVPREQQCSGLATEHLPMLVGQYFVQQAFDEQQRQLAESLLANVIDKMEKRFEDTEWLDNKSRGEAIDKLKALQRMIAKPDYAMTYPFVLERDTFSDNVDMITAHTWRRSLEQLWYPTHRSEWHLSPAEVNAYHSRTLNSVVFPAAYLVPLALDGTRHPAEAFGGIGMVMGHEVGHAFDAYGLSFDATGTMRDWIAPESEDELVKRVECFMAQYSKIEVFGRDGDSLGFVDGNQTIAENMADNSGLSVALDAYRDAVNGSKHGAKTHGITSENEGEQLFFLSFAQLWCSAMRDEAMSEQLDNDSHAPEAARVLGVLINSEDFARAYKCKVGTRMNPEAKCKVW
ncbi:hypothetical protein P43SY_001986 [Pythium insidiosum]|uniref:Uncharacterized protein n=1 Tax=Pythium insidiosum TaxID=114742 RepID=A0AAD5M2E0_PYTIN|nr:hypothetical protein P43SY_001986 [Pythium insidiosum]